MKCFRCNFSRTLLAWRINSFFFYLPDVVSKNEKKVLKRISTQDQLAGSVVSRFFVGTLSVGFRKHFVMNFKRNCIASTFKLTLDNSSQIFEMVTNALIRMVPWWLIGEVKNAKCKLHRRGRANSVEFVYLRTKTRTCVTTSTN